MMPPREVHVWVESIEGSLPIDLAASDAALLDREERDRLGRLVQAEDRVLYGKAHVGLRRILSCYADIAPASWKFRRDKHGRPEICEPESAASIRYNLTHTPGLFAVVIAIDREVGIDAEHLDRERDVDRIAAHAFAPCELEALQGQPSEDARRTLFFECWTLKEAYLKARGTGLSSPLDAFWFTLPLKRPIAIQFASGALHAHDFPAAADAVHDAASDWQFDLIAPTPVTRVAVALRRLRGEEPLEVRWMGPVHLGLATRQSKSRPA
jgi:4'-phosphopantetheinyl transferase